MNWKGCGRKWSWPNLRYYPGICLEGLGETTRNLSQDNRSPGGDLNPGPPEYEARVLSCRRWRSLAAELSKTFLRTAYGKESYTHTRAMVVRLESVAGLCFLIIWGPGNEEGHSAFGMWPRKCVIFNQCQNGYRKCVVLSHEDFRSRVVWEDKHW
jgi:hypothetical protein